MTIGGLGGAKAKLKNRVSKARAAGNKTHKDEVKDAQVSTLKIHNAAEEHENEMHGNTYYVYRLEDSLKSQINLEIQWVSKSHEMFRGGNFGSSWQTNSKISLEMQRTWNRQF